MTEQIKISEIKIRNRFRRDLGNLKPLMESIKEVGLLHPVVVSEDYDLIAGYRRLEACKALGWEKVSVNIVPLKDLIKGEFHENVIRKNFTVSEMVAIKRALEPEVRKEAKKRQILGKPCAKFAQGPSKTRDIIAKYVGISGWTLEKAERIVEAYERDPEKFEKVMDAVDSGKMSIDYAYKMVTKREEEPPPLPEGVFDVIYADPPWEYYLPLRGSPDMHYPTMSTEEICKLEIPVAEDAVLFLWATNPKLEDALEVMKSWGFEYKTNMCWVKDKFGTGYYFRGQHELLLLGKKGNMPAPPEEARPPSVLFKPSKRHSEKPEEVYDLIEKMFPGRRYLELFARNKRSGWTSWGIEID